jgi:hypothetical protein
MPKSSSKTSKKTSSTATANKSKKSVASKKTPAKGGITKKGLLVKSKRTPITKKSREKAAFERAAAAGVDVDRIKAAGSKKKGDSAKSKTDSAKSKTDSAKGKGATKVASSSKSKSGDAGAPEGKTKKKKPPKTGTSGRDNGNIVARDKVPGANPKRFYDIVLHEGASGYVKSPLYYDAETVECEKGTEKRVFPNPLGGESGRGTCLRFGVLRRGAGFEKNLERRGEEFLIELVERMVNYCRTKNRVIVTPNIACAALKRMGILTVDSYV